DDVYECARSRPGDPVRGRYTDSGEAGRRGGSESVTARCAALAIAASVAVQAPSPPAAAYHTETRLVVLEVSVKDRRGVEVPDLPRAAFTVYENGARQTITLFHHDDVPVTLGLVIDNSRSMRTLRSRVEAAALALVRVSNPLDEVFVVNF